MVKGLMDSLDLINNIATVLSDVSGKSPTHPDTNDRLSALIEKIDYRLKLIEAEEMGITLVPSADI